MALDADGDFVVVWESDGSDGTDTDSQSIQMRTRAFAFIFEDGFESGDLSAWSLVVGGDGSVLAGFGSDQ